MKNMPMPVTDIKDSWLTGIWSVCVYLMAGASFCRWTKLHKWNEMYL